MNTWIVGCGDIGRRISALYDDQVIQGIIQSEASKIVCEQANIKANRINLDKRKPDRIWSARTSCCKNAK